MQGTVLDRNGRLTMSTKIAYGIGQVGDSLPYNLFFIYYLFYLTDVAGIAPAVAGIINTLAISWNAIANPVIGYLSDNSKSKYGRRRPFILVGIPMIAVSLLLMFLPISFEGGAKNAYFILVAMLLWTSYVTYVIPYVALGAEITQDYNERNSLRGINNIIGYTVLILCSAGPAAIQGAMTARGYTVQQAWTFTGALFACIVIVFTLICWFVTKGKELPREQTAQTSGNMNLIQVFKETFKIKPYRILIGMVVLFVLGFNIINATLVYLLTYAAKLDFPQQSTFWIVYCLIIIFAQPILIKIMAKIGKKRMLLTATIIEIVANAAFFFVIGITDIVTLYSYAVILGVTSSCFWLLYISLVYDISEIDEYKNGKRREGSLIAIVIFLQKIGAALASLLTGVLLGVIGYQAGVVQSEETVKGIVMLCTIIPAGFYTLSMLIFSRYPVTQKRFEALNEALRLRKEGKPYNENEFKELL